MSFTTIYGIGARFVLALRLTRVRGVPLAGEVVDFDAPFRQQLDVLACPLCGTRLGHYRERLRPRHAGRPPPQLGYYFPR